MIKEAIFEDLPQILELYLHLHETAVPEESENLRCAWQKIMSDDNHHLVVCEVDGKIVSSCVCVIIPNLTRGVRPYAFVENVVTHADAMVLLSISLNMSRESTINYDKYSNCYNFTTFLGSDMKSKSQKQSR